MTSFRGARRAALAAGIAFAALAGAPALSQQAQQTDPCQASEGEGTRIEGTLVKPVVGHVESAAPGRVRVEASGFRYADRSALFNDADVTGLEAQVVKCGTDPDPSKPRQLPDDSSHVVGGEGNGGATSLGWGGPADGLPYNGAYAIRLTAKASNNTQRVIVRPFIVDVPAAPPANVTVANASEGTAVTVAWDSNLDDIVAVLALLASYVFFFDRNLSLTNPVAVAWLKWIGAIAGLVAIAGLGVLFILAGDPERLGRATERLARVIPSFAAVIAKVAEKFARGLGAIRHPRRLAVALLWSFPLWLSIAAGIWAVAVAFQLAMPFTGTFLIIALLVLGVAVPTPGAVGGFHAAFRYGATAFFGAPDDAAVGAAIVLHILSIGPSLLLGLYYAAQVGLNMSRMRELAVTAPGDAA
jgi:hypothetical protein